ncbi:glycosyltransferase family 4 protein [Rhodopila sp.]|uniref:glycosyltransferase family 4 protein n=1 Tax=Rhodopila sp. TaxID=2480087 RepID=UPI002C2DE239|nr:glycosyltransferase family 4 protein [Rhodopila sp.]HVZ10528.1 glycosyltransferase family 4 protein [Rhodopila sp.]
MQTPEALVATMFGSPLIAQLPGASPLSDSAAAFDVLAARLAGASVVLFDTVSPARLNDFFRLRLTQVLQEAPPLPALSVVPLTVSDDCAAVPGGFAERFRSSWPFERCVFATLGADVPPALMQLGVPVTRLDSAEAPVVLSTEAAAGQRVALQIQRIWPRCGSTTAFQNQVEALVRAGFLTIRVFAEYQHRRGETLNRTVARLLPENSVDWGAHIDVVAVPRGPYRAKPNQAANIAWASALAEAATCAIDDVAIDQAARRASAVMTNHLFTVGLALNLAPQAKLIFDLHDDIAAAYRQAALMQGGSGSDLAQAEAAANAVQAAVLAIPDLCTHVSQIELQACRLFSRQAAIVLPKPYVAMTTVESKPAFDLLLVGDRHPFNVASMTWFLEEVWRPYLEPAGLRLVVAGRVGESIDRTRFESSRLHIPGFVQDLEALRASCRLSVIPDRFGAGLPIKTLTALAAGHAVATTSHGLRGLDPALVGALPAFDTAADLAGDIVCLTTNPTALAERTKVVREIAGTLGGGPGYGDWLSRIPPPSQARQAERLEQWSVIVAPAVHAPVEPFRLPVGERFPMSGSAWDDQVLLEGWHLPEQWGRWMDGTRATALLPCDPSFRAPLALEMDVEPSPIDAALSILLNQATVATLRPVAGSNVLVLPPALIARQSALRLEFRAAGSVCPADTGARDERVLGIGFRGLRLVPWAPLPLSLRQTVRINRAAHVPRGALLGSWHPIEDWGCWTSGTDAIIRASFDAPLSGQHRLQLDLAATPVPVTLTISVDGVALPTGTAKAGRNTWLLPRHLTEGRREIALGLHVLRPYSPKLLGRSGDDRILGVGVQGIGITPVRGPVTSLGSMVQVTAGVAEGDLLPDGWHGVEAWGCWTRQPVATALLGFNPALPHEDLLLELNLTAPLSELPLTLIANGAPLPPRLVRSGSNIWPLPRSATAGKDDLRIDLRLDRTVRPVDIGASADERQLGVGLRSLRVYPNA